MRIITVSCDGIACGVIIPGEDYFFSVAGAIPFPVCVAIWDTFSRSDIFENRTYPVNLDETLMEGDTSYSFRSNYHGD